MFFDYEKVDGGLNAGMAGCYKDVEDFTFKFFLPDEEGEGVVKNLASE